MKYILILLLLTACGSTADRPTAQGLLSLNPVDPALIETRFCGAPKRDANGVIIRSSKVTAAFRAENPCPATGLTTGACPDWQMDHVKPIADGWCDSVTNMQWLPKWLKTCAGHCKDRWERKINCRPIADGGTGCTNSVITPP